MDNSVNPEKLKKAPIASSCFMGLGQILYLKQYVRGALFALVEVIMLCCIIFGSKKIVPANNNEYNYLKGTPDTDEMIGYLEDAGYSKLDSVLNKKEKELTKFFKKLGKNKKVVAEFGENPFGDVDFTDYYSMEDAIYTIEDVEDFDYTKYEDQFFGIVEKYDHTLAVAMAKKAAKEYNVQKKETLKEYKGESKDKIKEELSKVLNEFDEHYDGCSLCKRATKKGLRTTVHRAWFRGPVVTSIAGLFTLGSKQNTTVTKYMDHSVFMMINGILCLIIIGFFVILYIFNINGTKKAVAKIIKNNKFPTWEETRNDISQNSFATLCISPAIVMIAIFSLVPLLFSALVAFTNYSSPDHIPPNNLVDWVGLSNFVQMFSMKIGGGEWAKSFVNAAIWTLVWAIFATLTCFFVGFFYAFVLQDKRVVIPKFFRTVYILPYAIPTMLSLFVWANLLNGTVGPINRTLQLLGFIEQPIPWLSNPWVAKGSLIFVNIWIGFPYSMILTTSSMTAISNSLYEAAVIDGATKWQQFKSITYPLVMFQLKPTLIMQFASNINNFGAVFFLTGGGPNLPQAGLTTATSCGSTDLLISWIYKLTMNTPSRYNLASVLSLLVFVVLVPFALYSFTRTKSFKEGEV